MGILMHRTALFLSLAFAAAAAPHRIVSLSPNVTELLYGVGAFPQVVGVSDYCTYPPEVKNLPSVGGWHDPSLEKLAAMRPDLVVVDDGQAPFVQDSFQKLGLNLMVVPTHRVEDVYRAMDELGKARFVSAIYHWIISWSCYGFQEFASSACKKMGTLS